MVDKILASMLSTLNAHKRSRDELDNNYLHLRLSKSLINYIADLDESKSYLDNRNQTRLIRRITK